ncbi:MAG: helix-turn-helix domain-containing protein [Mogibacterium sp.]|nr:helix-turn-helix domain-containing protein [Mogibacterium sp.]
MKYPYELRLKIALEYFTDHIGGNELADKYGVPRKSAFRWIRLYEQHGARGIYNPSGRYSGEFKVHVVEYMHNSGMSLTETANYFGIQAHSTISKWERIYYEEGRDALLRFQRGQGRRKMKKVKQSEKKKSVNENEDLLAEVQRLRMENEYLKKLNALVQEREKQEQKRK